MDHSLNLKHAEIKRLRREIIQKKQDYFSHPSNRNFIHISSQKPGRFGQKQPKLRGRSHHLTNAKPPANLSPPSPPQSIKFSNEEIKKNIYLFDGYDRIKENGIRYAVVENGYLFIPLDLPLLTPSTIVSNEVLPSKEGYQVISPQLQPRGPQHCRFYTREGFCRRGVECGFVHDPNRIRLCRNIVEDGDFGSCECLLNHDGNEYNSEWCFDADCECHRLHCYKRENVAVCRPFAITGYCSRGLWCPFVHKFICPDFEENGSCFRGNRCELDHLPTKRIQMMMATPGFVEYEVNKGFIDSYSVDYERLFTRSDTREGERAISVKTEENGDGDISIKLEEDQLVYFRLSARERTVEN